MNRGQSERLLTRTQKETGRGGVMVSSGRGLRGCLVRAVERNLVRFPGAVNSYFGTFTRATISFVGVWIA